MRIRIRDPVPFLILDPGWKKFGPGISIRICKTGYWVHVCHQFVLKILKFFDADPDPGSGIFSTLDPGWKNRTRDKHPVSATLMIIRKKEKRQLIISYNKNQVCNFFQKF